LADAQRQQVERYLFLGDVGRDVQLFTELQHRGIECLFGNWEVSGLRHLPPQLADWVQGWPATRQIGQAIFAHATPAMPSTAASTVAAAKLMNRGTQWSQLFPGLIHNDEARWQAFALLEAADLRVAFHGHTHVQLAWSWTAAGDSPRQLRSIAGPATITLAVGNPHAPNRYLIGVGSAGQPDDGPQLRYTLYDDENNIVELRRL
jgi:diadenosine tetraphosphatase ApaH/serine/threonine PP2A family protein phosphatase